MDLDEMHWDMNFSRSAFSSSNRCCRRFNRLSNFSIRLSYCSFSRISVVSTERGFRYRHRTSAILRLDLDTVVGIRFHGGLFLSAARTDRPPARRISTDAAGMVSIFLEPFRSR